MLRTPVFTSFFDFDLSTPLWRGDTLLAAPESTVIYMTSISASSHGALTSSILKVSNRCPSHFALGGAFAPTPPHARPLLPPLGTKFAITCVIAEHHHVVSSHRRTKEDAHVVIGRSLALPPVPWNERQHPTQRAPRT